MSIRGDHGSPDGLREDAQSRGHDPRICAIEHAATKLQERVCGHDGLRSVLDPYARRLARYAYLAVLPVAWLLLPLLVVTLPGSIWAYFSATGMCAASSMYDAVTTTTWPPLVQTALLALDWLATFALGLGGIVWIVTFTVLVSRTSITPGGANRCESVLRGSVFAAPVVLLARIIGCAAA